MASADGYAPLSSDSDTLSPLPDNHRAGLIAISTCGALSFLSTTILFLYLTYKLVKWQLRQSQPEHGGRHINRTTDLSLGLSQGYFIQSRSTSQPPAAELRVERNVSTTQKKPVNQFLLLVYSLFFADMHQAMAFGLNSSWAGSNAILVGTSTCWAQGWFVSVGDLAASCFVTAIAVHTYLTIIKGYRPPQWAVYATIAGLWVFAYALAIIGILITNNGRAEGGLYVRATAWCWMNAKYDKLRLWLHYFWIFISLTTTSCIYILIFFKLYRDDQFSRPLPHSHASGSIRRQAPDSSEETAGGKYPGFLIYPVIYVLATAPLALGRIASMSGRDFGVEYFCFAGAMIASNGWLDVLLFSWTRSLIIFGESPDIEESGLNTFNFMRTPHTRQFGNIVWVEGGVRGTGIDEQDRGREHQGWWKLGGERGQRGTKGSINWARGPHTGSTESLRGAAMHDGNTIQMNTVTSVIVELEPHRKESAGSTDSSEEGFEHSPGGV